MASAGCIGELCAFQSEEELKNVLLQHILGQCKFHYILTTGTMLAATSYILNIT